MATKSMLRKIDTLIIDLDNTIFDWFAVWYASFRPIYDAIKTFSDKSIEEIEADIRRVHQLRGTSEYSFLIEELDVLQNIDKDGDRRQQFSKAIQDSQSKRDKIMKPYDGVFQSLWNIKNKGTKIIAYTESMAFYSAYRLKRFGLDGVIDVLYSPKDHTVPFGTSVSDLRRLPDEFYQLQVTQSKHTPAGELKPNPKVLLDIIKSESVNVDRCAYVGDSLFKDVAMARDVGVLDIHAKYGESQRKPEYELLQRVSHWTEDDVKRETEITELGHDFEPSIVLKEHFLEIFMYCDFNPFVEIDNLKQSVDNEFALETWKKAVDVQQHFNDMQMKLRNYAITIVAAMIAAVGFTFQSGLKTSLLGFSFPAGVLLIITSMLAWYAFYFIDRFGYHSLLKGAVSHAGKIENEYKDRIPGIGLGNSISEASQSVKFFGLKADSNARLILFYLAGGIMLGILLVGFMFATESVATIEASKSPPATITENE